jgi:hypothetical protein
MTKITNIPYGFNAGSIKALYCEILIDEDSPNPIASGTAFIGLNQAHAEGGFKAVLLTARHNVTGKDHFQPDKPISNYSCDVRLLRVYFPKIENPFSWFSEDFPLYLGDDSKEPNWLEHPISKSNIDVVGIPLNAVLLEKIHPGSFVNLHNSSDDQDGFIPSAPLYVIGFPLRRKANYLAVWSGGTLAYEPKFDFPYIDNEGVEQQLPAYLISARTFSGQSGSLVIEYAGQMGGWDGKRFSTGSGTRDEILGMYTCRISADNGSNKETSDLGLVWKQQILFEILNSSTVLYRSGRAD